METDDVIMDKSHKLLSTMFSTLESLVKSSVALDSRDKKNAEKCVQDRKKAIIKPIMLAATILDPAAMGSHLTQEVINFIFDTAKKSNYRAKTDIFGNEFAWVSCGNISPLIWWKSFFGHTDLARLADRILTTPLTSAATERSFNTFGNTHTKKRNRLTTERVW